MLGNHFVQECTIISPSRNEYSDYLYSGSGTTETCRFREISTIRRGSYQELNDADAMIWLSPSTVAQIGSIILFDNVYYQVERLTKARRLGESTVQFIKCDLKITDIGVS